MTNWRIERRDAVEIWTIDGEARRNTLTKALVEELGAHVERVRSDRSVRVVVLTGSGPKAFCAGADLKDREKMTKADIVSWLELLHGVFRSVEVAPQVFIAAMNGAAFGGGLELALSCDLRVADPVAMMGLTEVKLAIIPGAGGTQRLPRIIGSARAKELIFTGRRVSAGEALSIGLVNRVSEPGKVIDAALALASEIVANAPLAVSQAKAAINEGWDLPWDEAAALERAKYHPLIDTSDRLEGLAAFREKRPPNYRGR